MTELIFAVMKVMKVMKGNQHQHQHQQLSADLLDATRRLRRIVRRQSRQFAPDLPPTELEVIHAVHDAPGVGVGELAASLGLAPNTVSTLVKSLGERGLIERRPNAADRRGCDLTVTPTGAELVGSGRDQRAELVAAAIVKLSPADRLALREGTAAIGRLLQALEEPGAG